MLLGEVYRPQVCIHMPMVISFSAFMWENNVHRTLEHCVLAFVCSGHYSDFILCVLLMTSTTLLMHTDIGLTSDLDLSSNTSSTLFSNVLNIFTNTINMLGITA